MPTTFPATSEPGVPSLVHGIVNDIGDLIKQQVEFAKAEIKADLRKSTQAVALLAAGAGSALLGMVFLGLMLVHLLHWLTEPAGIDPAGLPLWGCHAIVAVLFLASGAALFYLGKRMMSPSEILPVQTAETLKENVEWITNSK
jgi:hypothetical protein